MIIRNISSVFCENCVGWNIFKGLLHLDVNQRIAWWRHSCKYSYHITLMNAALIIFCLKIMSAKILSLGIFISVQSKEFHVEVHMCEYPFHAPTSHWSSIAFHRETASVGIFFLMLTRADKSHQKLWFKFHALHIGHIDQCFCQLCYYLPLGCHCGWQISSSLLAVWRDMIRSPNNKHRPFLTYALRYCNSA
jgi:hypothetical protein